MKPYRARPRLLALAVAGLLAALAADVAARPLFYVSGNLESGPAGAMLEAPMVVRNGFGDERQVQWRITNDSTGGAKLSTGGTTRLVSVGGGEAAAESITFGPSAGVVGVAACIGSQVGGTTAFECTPDANGNTDTAYLQTFALTATGASAPVNSASGLTYVSGNGQTAEPGNGLPNVLRVRNTRSDAQNLAFFIVNDDTGGAQLGNGAVGRVVLVPPGLEVSEALTLGPANGFVQVVACYVRAAAGANSGFDCESSDGLAQSVVFAAQARGANEPVVTCSGVQHAGTELTLAAPDGAMRYDWDVDGDGVMDRTGSDNELPLTYPTAFSDEITVMITDQSGQQTTTRRTISTVAPDLDVEVSGAPTQVCGDGDASPEPGERWSLPVRVTNDGAQASEDGFVAFAPQDRVTASAAGNVVEGGLEVEQPAIGVGNLAPGASIDRNVQVTLKPSALCGTAYGLAYTGSVDAISSAAGSANALAQFALPAAAQCQVFTGGCAATKAAPIQPRQGLYLNANRAGNGLSNFLIPVPGGAPVFFGAWFTAAADRSPTWYVIQGPMVGNVVVAPILRFTRDVNAQAFTVSSTRVGQAVVALLGPERMLLTYDVGGRQGAELMTYFVGGNAPSPNRSGAWYNESEAGWGQVIHQYVADGVQSTFAVHYLYDATGAPRWVLTQGATAALTAPSAHLTYRVHCPGCPLLGDWADFAIPAGTGTVLLPNATTGTIGTQFTLPAPFAGTWTRANLPITLLTAPQ